MGNGGKTRVPFNLKNDEKGSAFHDTQQCPSMKIRRDKLTQTVHQVDLVITSVVVSVLQPTGAYDPSGNERCPWDGR